MLKKILGFVILLAVGIVAYAAMQPPQYQLSREMLINATPEVLFPYINNSKKANDWMPWKDSDPQMKMEFSGPDEGVGSTSSWDSQGQMGTGKAEVVESIPNKSVKTKLTYTRPMSMSQLAEISLTPVDSGTKVRWEVRGENALLCRVVCLFMDMDKMIGGEFEKGLSKLKVQVEAGR